MKKIIIFLLCLSFLNIPVLAKEDYSSYYFERADYKEAITFLSAVGILSAEDTSLDTDKWEITRGEFVQLALRCVGQEEAAENSQILGKFSDVDSNSEYGKLILYAADCNFFGNNLSLSFRPNDPLDMELAARMAVCMTGRAVTVNQSKTYLGVAFQGKFFTDVEIYDNDKISRGGAFYLLKNILSADLVVAQSLTSGGTGIFSTQKGITLLHEYLGMEKREGVVTSDGITTVFGEEAETGFLCIDGVSYLSAFSSAQGLAGKMTEYYVQLQDNEPVIRYIVEKDNEVITLDSDDILSFNPASASYVTNIGRQESFNIDRKAYIAYNFEPHYSPEKMIPDNGVVTLINHNNDKYFDVVLIENFTNTIVNSYSTYSETIYDLKDSSRNIDLSSYKNCRLVDFNGTSIFPEEIKKYSIASLYESADSDSARVVVCYNKKTGEISEADNDEGTYVIGNQIYSLSGDPRFDKKNLSMGSNFEFYLDVLGNITYIATNHGEMAYLLNAYKYPGFSDKIEVQVLPEENKKLMVYELAKKVKVTTPTEKKVMSKADLYKEFLTDSSGEAKRQMMLVKFNSDDEISQIITALDIKSYGELIAAPDYPLYYMSYLKSEWPEKLGASSDEMMWKYTTGGFNRWIILGSGAQMFYVPNPEDEIEDEESVVVKTIDYGTSTRGSLPKNNISFYSKDKDDVSIRYMVNYATADNAADIGNTWPFVVTGMKMVYRESTDDYTWRINLQGAGEEQVLLAKDENVVLKENIIEKARIRDDKTRIDVGDIIRFAKDESGNIKTISLLWDAKANIDKTFNDEGDTSPRFGMSILEEQSGWDGDQWTPVAGNIVRKSDNVLEVTVDKNDTMQTVEQRLQRVRWGGHNTNLIIDYSTRKPTVTIKPNAEELVVGDRIIILTWAGQSYIVLAYRR